MELLRPNSFLASCVMATAILKENIEHYTSNGSNVHATFLDLSKAFDKVNHSVLLCKLIDCNIPSDIVGVFAFMFDNQFVNVCFNNEYSCMWKLRNGVRQGGILSTTLFNLYINEILDHISEQNVGCIIMTQRSNIQGYADDLSVLAPSSKSLQSLLNKLEELLKGLCLTLNTVKSV